MLKKNTVLFVLLSLVLTGCASTQGFLPKDYKGPTAILEDSSNNFVEGTLLLPAKVDFFYVESIDNKTVTNALIETRSQFQGRGFWFKPVSQRRRVPAKTITVNIAGSTYYGAPIGAIFGKVYQVRRTVKFRPSPGKRYFVRGKLAEGQSSVWIETGGGRVVGRNVVAKK